MKINEVLEYETEEELGHLEPLADALEAETGDNLFSSYYFHTDKFSEIKIKVIKNFKFDYRHKWFMGVVYFRDRRVMILQAGGKDGGSPRGSWVLDAKAYMEMIHYWKLVVLENDDEFIYNLEKDWDREIPSLGDFFGQKLTEEFKEYEN